MILHLFLLLVHFSGLVNGRAQLVGFDRSHHGVLLLILPYLVSLILVSSPLAPSASLQIMSLPALLARVCFDSIITSKLHLSPVLFLPIWEYTIEGSNSGKSPATAHAGHCRCAFLFPGRIPDQSRSMSRSPSASTLSVSFSTLIISW